MPFHRSDAEWDIAAPFDESVLPVNVDVDIIIETEKNRESRRNHLLSGSRRRLCISVRGAIRVIRQVRIPLTNSTRHSSGPGNNIHPANVFVDWT